MTCQQEIAADQVPPAPETPRRRVPWGGILVPLILIASATLAMIRLDNTYFWDDEALVGIVAKNLLVTGRLTGWDGRNLLAYRNGTALDENLRPINAPLDAYLAAASFRLFGVNTWAGRFPFVLTGLAALAVLATLLAEDFGRDSPARIYGLAFLALSTVFLLNMRQCRYYTLELMCCLYMFWAYRWALATKQWRYFLLLAAAGTGAFYASYLLGPAFWLAVGAYHLLFHRKGLTGRDCWKLGCSLALLAAATIPYAFIYRIWHRPDVPACEAWYVRGPVLLWWNLRELNLLGYMPWMLGAVGLLGLAIKYRRDPAARTALRWAVLALAYVFFLSLLTNQSVTGGELADVRYLIPAAPFLAGFAGWTLALLHGLRRWTKPLAWSLLAMALVSTLLAIGPAHTRLRWLLPAYLKEIAAPYPTGYRLASEYLDRHALQDEVVYAWPGYCNYPLMFYLGDKLRFGCLLEQDTHLGLELVRWLDAPLLMEENVPDWYVAFGIHEGTFDCLELFQRPGLLNGKPARHTYRLIQMLDAYWWDRSRPELHWHDFGPWTGYDRDWQAVYVYRRGGPKEIEQDPFVPSAE